MKKHEKGDLSYKLDVILSGQETIGSAERSTNVEQMRDEFHSISDGLYAETLYDKLGKDNVEKELDDYLGTPTISRLVRSGAGIGVTRLIRSMRMEGLLPDDVLGKTKETSETNTSTHTQ